MQRIITPQTMNESDSLALGSLLRGAFQRGQYYVSPSEAFSNRYAYVQHRGKNRPYFEVVDDATALSADCLSAREMQDDGGVFPILGKIELDNADRARFIPHKERRVLKRQIQLAGDDRVEELRIAQHVRHLRSMHPEVAYSHNSKNKRCYVMRAVEGQSLEAFLQQNPNLSIDKRFKISIYLLRALEKEFHDLRIIHRDVKPDNVIINPVTLKVHFIDTDLALHGRKEDIVAGTGAYAAPEAILNPESISTAADVYSLGLLLRSDLWGGGSREDYLQAVPVNQHQSAQWYKLVITALRQNRELAHDVPLFQKLPFSEQAKSYIPNLKPVFKLLNAFQPNLRCTAAQAAHLFEAAYFDYLCNEFPQHIRQFEKAKRLAGQLTARWDLKVRQGDVHSRLSLGDEPQQLLVDLQQTLAQLSDQPNVVSYFVHLTQVMAFNGLTSKKAILTKAQAIVSSAKCAIDEVQDRQVLLEQSNRLQQRLYPQAAQVIAERLSLISVKIEELKHRLGKMLKTYDHNGAEVTEPVYNSSFDNLNKFVQLNAALVEAIKVDQAALSAELSAYHKSYVKKNVDIFKQLRPLALHNPTTAVKNALREALQDYLHQRKTLTKRRAEDLKALLRIDAPTEQAFTQQVDRRLSQLRTGLFGRSKMRDNVRLKMNPFACARQR